MAGVGRYVISSMGCGVDVARDGSGRFCAVSSDLKASIAAFKVLCKLVISEMDIVTVGVLGQRPRVMYLRQKTSDSPMNSVGIRS